MRVPKVDASSMVAGKGGGRGVADGAAFFVERGLSERAAELCLAGLGGAVLLFSLASPKFPRDHEHARAVSASSRRAVHFDVQGLDGLGRIEGRRLHEPRPCPLPATDCFEVVVRAPQRGVHDPRYFGRPLDGDLRLFFNACSALSRFSSRCRRASRSARDSYSRHKSTKRR